MKKFMQWMTDVVGPKMEKASQNAWLAGLQDSINRVLPFILVGSLITVYNVIRNYIPSLPNLTDVRNYTFGLVSLFMSFLIPYFILTRKHRDNMKYVAGLTGIALFMMIVNPVVTDEGYLYQFSYFGAGGMFVSIVSGMFVAFVMNLFAKFTFFKEDSAIPGFIRQWFDTLIPIAVVIIIGFIIIIQCKFDLYNFIVSLFMPLVGIAQTFPGMLLLYLVPTVFYSLGISGWVFTPILTPIALAAITANAEAGASNIFCDEVVYTFIALGGRGGTLPLNILMLKCKSKKLKTLSRACIGPSVLNINEPIVYGTVVWNPLLMIPMWINAVVSVIIVYLAMATHLVAVPSEVFSLWYCPAFLSGFLVSGIPGVLLTVVVFAVTAVIWYPFLMVYDKQCLEEEKEDELAEA